MTHLPFDPPEQILDADALGKIARSVGERRDLWEGNLDRTREERTYAEVFASEHLGVWAISWADDSHDTGFHDHATSCGAVYVVEGTIRHEHLRLGEPPTGTSVPSGEEFTFDDTCIHRMRKEPDAEPAVTIHAYSPPLEWTGQYGESDDGLLHRWPTRSDEQLKPHGTRPPPKT